MSGYAILREIQRRDPVKDHQRIVFLSCCHDFSCDTTRALEFVLFRTFCVPSISALLDRTGEFEDTDIIFNELTNRAMTASAAGVAPAAAAHPAALPELSAGICDRRIGAARWIDDGARRRDSPASMQA